MRTGQPGAAKRVSIVASDGERAGLAVAPALLAALPLAGRLVTGDALYCQAALCCQIRQQAGDSLVTVKANQPESPTTTLTTAFGLSATSPKLSCAKREPELTRANWLRASLVRTTMSV